MKKIFLSYSSKTKKCVETLYNDLSDLPDYELWIDKKLSGGQQWWDEILANIRTCDLFIVALSQELLDSEACTRERNYATRLGKHILSVVVNNNFKLNLLPAELKIKQSVSYYPERYEGLKLANAINSFPPLDSLPEPLPEPPEMPISYLDELAVTISSSSRLSFEAQATILVKLKEKIHIRDEWDDVIALFQKMKERDDLFNKIGNQIDDILKNAKTELKSGAITVHSKEHTVFLGDATDDLEQECKGVKSYLNQYGIDVLPNTAYSLEPEKFRLATESDVAQCSVFVQLLSACTGKKPADLPKGYLQLQYDIARNSGKPVRQWRSPHLDIASIQDHDHRALVSGGEVRAESIEEFKKAIKELVLKPPPVKKSVNLDAVVFVNMEKKDEEIADKVCHELSRHGIDYTMPCFTEDDPSEIRRDLEERLTESNGIIIIYGNSKALWVRRQITESRKILKNEAEKHLVAICECPPEDKDPVNLFYQNIQVLDLKKGMDGDRLDKEIVLFIDSILKQKQKENA